MNAVTSEAVTVDTVRLLLDRGADVLDRKDRLERVDDAVVRDRGDVDGDVGKGDGLGAEVTVDGGVDLAGAAAGGGHQLLAERFGDADERDAQFAVGHGLLRDAGGALGAAGDTGAALFIRGVLAIRFGDEDDGGGEGDEDGPRDLDGAGPRPNEDLLACHEVLGEAETDYLGTLLAKAADDAIMIRDGRIERVERREARAEQPR